MAKGPLTHLARPLALACLLAASGAAQTDPLPERPPEAPESSRNETVATVNGEIVTAADVEYRAGFMARAGRPVDAEATAVLRQHIAEDLLLAAECERLGVELTDQDVKAVWPRVMGGEFPDLKLVAEEAGTTVERQRDLARTIVLARLFLYHKVGLRGDFSHRLPPDPVLQRVVSITPGDLKQAFIEQKSYFDEPPSVIYTVFPCDSEDLARSVQMSLTLGERPVEPRGVTEQTALDRLDELFAFAPSLAEFLREGQQGEVSAITAYSRRVEDETEGPLEDDRAWLVVLVLERGEGREADFLEIQPTLRSRLLERRLGMAKEQLVADLIPQAVYWPADLFTASVARPR